MSKEDPKVTECWTALHEDGSPDVDWTIWMIDPKSEDFKRVIAIKAEDYDAMRKELEELRAYKQGREADDTYRRECAERKRTNKVWGLEEKWEGSKE